MDTLLDKLHAQQARVSALCIVCGKLGQIKASDDGKTVLCVPCYLVAMGESDDHR